MPQYWETTLVGQKSDKTNIGLKGLHIDDLSPAFSKSARTFKINPVLFATPATVLQPAITGVPPSK